MISFVLGRVRLGVLLFLLSAFLVSVLANPRTQTATWSTRPVFGINSKIQERSGLTLPERVYYQTALEEVYWRHRTWSRDNAGRRPSFTESISAEQIRARVEDYLRQSVALETYWNAAITPEQLQAEMQRMASETKDATMLRELWAALDNDPYLIAECLARPILVGRQIRELYAFDDRFHGPQKQALLGELQEYASVGQMRHLSGQYQEIEYVRRDDEHGSGSGQRSISLSADEWKHKIEALDSAIGRKTSKVQTASELSVGTISSLQEEADRFSVVAATSKTSERLVVVSVVWPKQSFDLWWRAAGLQFSTVAAAAWSSAGYQLPEISPSASCSNDTWKSIARPPAARSEHTAIWTGSEMIIWGGRISGSDVFESTGFRYTPATDSWQPTNTMNAPSARGVHTAVWTGTEMLIWGGFFFSSSTQTNTGGRYNPATDNWIATSTINAPAARSGHTAIWTGSEMIVWGGSNGLNSGGRYNPTFDSWSATTTTNAPSGRGAHAAVWTGSEMIIWGGIFSSNLNTGARYKPQTDSWVATTVTNAPLARSSPTAVWTGSEMIVWGGDTSSGGILQSTNTGGRYNPATNAWTATSLTNAPRARALNAAVWTGNELIIWGGARINQFAYENTGARYNPITDSWVVTTLVNAPFQRSSPTAVWTGEEMLVWGGAFIDVGFNDLGGRYCAQFSPGGNADLSVTSTISPDPGVSGSPITYKFTVTNNGPDAAQSVTFTDSCTRGDGSPCGAGFANNTQQTFSSIAANTSQTVTIVDNPDCAIVNGTVINHKANAIGVTNDPNTNNNSNTATTTVSNSSTISPTNQSFPAVGGFGTISLTALGGCPWTAISNASWIVIASSGQGSGNATVQYSVLSNDTSAPRSGTLTIAGRTFTVNQSANAFLSFSQSGYTVNETSGSVTLTVNRTNDTSPAVTVDYTTDDTGASSNCAATNGTASSRCDFTLARGTLQFASGETSKAITVLVNRDSFTEGAETFKVNLSNPTGAAAIASPSSATITINDGAAGPPANLIDDATVFVRMHYHDFLNREPDQSGLDFWTSQITSCGNDAACTELKRINVSGSFFLSIEFQQTGYLVERIYKVAYGDANGISTLGGAHQLAVPVVRFTELLQDTQRVGRGVVVLQPGWEQALENNKQAYALEFVQTLRFVNAFPTSMTPAQLVDKMNTNAGNVLSASERTTAINLFANAADTTNVNARAQALRQIAEDTDLYNAEFNRAFVLATYIGYLRRNPNDAPDSDYTGYDFWLGKLNQFNGDYIKAEIVKAFISSSEYRQRFGP